MSCLLDFNCSVDFRLEGYFDGACRGNPGPASSGGVLKLICFDCAGIVSSEWVLWQGCRRHGDGTNYLAEMAGAKLVLEKVLELLVAVLEQASQGQIYALESI